MTTIEKLNAVIDNDVHHILVPLAVQAAQAAITEIEALTRALDAACVELGNYCPAGIEECSASCSECWRRYLLAKVEQERTES